MTSQPYEIDFLRTMRKILDSIKVAQWFNALVSDTLCETIPVQSLIENIS